LELVKGNKRNKREASGGAATVCMGGVVGTGLKKKREAGTG